MNQPTTTAGPRVLVAGVGSPWSDDRVGWLAVDRLKALCDPLRSTASIARSLAGEPWVASPDTAVVRLRSPLDLLDQLTGLEDLISLHLIDACVVADRPDPAAVARPAGSVLRLAWPDPRIMHLALTGTHDWGLPAVLELAARLSLLPAEVQLWVAVVRPPESSSGPSAIARQPELPAWLNAALENLVSALWAELRSAAIDSSSASTPRPEPGWWHHA